MCTVAGARLGTVAWARLCAVAGSRLGIVYSVGFIARVLRVCSRARVQVVRRCAICGGAHHLHGRPCARPLQQGTGHRLLLEAPSNGMLEHTNQETT